MNLKAIRQLFAQHSGRYDLVGTNGEDLGADIFIRQGQKYLDRRIEIDAGYGEIYTTIAASQLSIDVPLRAVHSIWIYDESDTKGMTELFRLGLREARQQFSNASGFANVDSGTPKYYTLGIARDDRPTPYKTLAKRLLILPPPDRALTLVAKGSLYQKELKGDSDSNFWTLEEPLMLVTSAMLQIEILYRNSEGMSDMLNALEIMISNLEMNQVEQDSFASNADRALNSWRYINELPIPNRPAGPEVTSTS